MAGRLIFTCPDMDVSTTPDGERLRVVAGSEHLGNDAELTRDEAEQLRDALDGFLGDRPAADAQVYVTDDGTVKCYLHCDDGPWTFATMQGRRHTWADLCKAFAEHLGDRPADEQAPTEQRSALWTINRPHPFQLLEGSGNLCVTCTGLPGDARHDPKLWDPAAV